MSAPVSHWFGPYGPRCGTRDGVNALDMDDETVTCKRCIKAPRSPFDAITPQWTDGRWVCMSLRHFLHSRSHTIARALKWRSMK